MFNPNQPRDSNGQWSGATANGITRYPVAPHNGVPSVGTHSSGPGFTLNKRTGKTPASGFAVAGAPSSSKYVGGGNGWATEHVNVVRGAALAKSLGRMRDQIAVYDLTNRREIATGGTDKGRSRRAA